MFLLPWFLFAVGVCVELFAVFAVMPWFLFAVGGQICLLDLFARILVNVLFAEKLLHAPSGDRIELEWLVDALSPSFGALESTPAVVKLVVMLQRLCMRRCFEVNLTDAAKLACVSPSIIKRHLELVREVRSWLMGLYCSWFGGRLSATSSGWCLPWRSMLMHIFVSCRERAC